MLSFFFFLRWAGLSEVVILYTDDWVHIFVLLVVWMRRSAQGITGSRVMQGLVFKWFPLWESSLLDTPEGRSSLVVCTWSQHPHSKGSGLDLWPEMEIPQMVCYGIKWD